MTQERIDLQLDANLEPLRASLKEAEEMVARLDRVVGQHAKSISRTLAGIMAEALNQQGTNGQSLERVAAPLLAQLLKGLGGQGMAGGATPPIRMSVNPQVTPTVSSRASRGQILADLASAIATATRRYS